MTQRYKPSRAGIINIWDYGDQVFTFSDGRLVLRGPNGSGKTKALELLFPLVFDGRLDARRLDPFSGEARTMKSNLLYRGKKVAFGYAWMEFERGEGDHVTIGVGLSVKAEDGSPKSWFFAAPGRVGGAIHLIDDERRPLQRRALKEQLGEGQVFKLARDYRWAVDRLLFGLGSDRYEAMLDLVLTLRRPQLARELDPSRLKAILTQGLRPVDEELVIQVAVAFDHLDAVQRELNGLERAEGALGDFLTAYRTYLRAQAKRRLLDFSARDGAVAQAAEEVRGIQQLLEDAQERQETEGDRLRALGVERAQAEAAEEALKESEAYREAQDIDRLAEQVREAAAALGQAEERHRAQTEDTERAEDRRSEADARLGQAQSAQGQAQLALSQEALGAQIELDLDPLLGQPRALEDHLRAAVIARRDDLAATREALEASKAADAGQRLAQEALSRAEGAEAVARGALEEEERRVREAREALTDALEAWFSARPEGVVSAEDLAALRGAVQEIGGDGGDLPGILQGRQAPQRRALTEAQTRLSVEVEAAGAALEAQRSQRDAVAAETDDAPAPIPGRGAGREGRPGAPLWRLVDFAPGLTPGEMGALEAALQGAGILDAWVYPEAPTHPPEGDAHLTPGPAAPGPTLLDVLAIEPEGDAPAARVRALLGAIPLGTGGLGLSVAFDTEGRYRLGPLEGRATAPEPSYIGATARAARRRRRLAELDASIAEGQSSLEALDQRLRAAASQARALEDAVAELPPPAPLRQALARALRQRGALDQAAHRSVEERQRLSARTREAAEARRQLRETARERRVPGDAEGMGALAAAVERVEAGGRALLSALEGARRAAEIFKDADDQARRARRALEARQAERDEARERHGGHAARHEALVGARGAAAAEVLERLGILQGRLRSLKGDIAAAAEAQRAAEREVARAGGRMEGARAALESATSERRRSEERLDVFNHPDFRLELALGPEGPAFPERLGLVLQDVSGEEQSARAAASRVTNLLQPLEQGLGANFTPALDLRDDIMQITIADADGRHSVAHFRRRLGERLEDQRLLLSEQERSLFEDHLLGALCGQLHQRIQGARELVKGMDGSMAARRMSSGQTIGLDWRAGKGLEDADRRTLKLLDVEATHLGPKELGKLRKFFAEQVKAARREQPERPYLDLLSEVLDYRRWHEFVLSLRSAGGTRQELTRKRYGELSGGEKSVALHLPLFAAAHAQYNGARLPCPRLIALDEAFAGIDAVGRPELLALTVAFDLDLFLTGYDLWVTDGAVPAVMHYDLYHDPLSGAVSTERFLWDGAALNSE